MSEISPTDKTPAPKYTDTDENFSVRLEPFQKDDPKHPIIPVTKHPDLIPDPTTTTTTHGNSQRSLQDTSYASSPLTKPAATPATTLQADIVTALFACISAADTEAVSHLIRDQGLITPDCPNAEGETPLLASIRARSAPTTRALLVLGADPNLPGTPPAASAWDGNVLPRAAAHGGLGGAAGGGITPLMLAAATGQLAIVKLLVGEYAADDSVVGPRGETALWLAAKAGHRDVVAYLPARRGGAWRRLRHSKEVAALKKAVVTTGKVGRCLGYTVPRGLVYDIPRAVGRFAWRKRWRIWGLVVGVVKGFPRFLGELVQYVFTEMPRDVWRVVMWVARAVPRAWGALWKGVLDAVKKLGGAFAYAAQRLVSALHSFFVAVIGFIKQVKLKDLGHDLLIAMEALLVKLPGAVWTFLVQSVGALKGAVKACFKNDWVRFFFSIALGIVFIVPRTLWKMLESLWACLGRGLEELISLLNPKMVTSKNSRP